MGESGQMETITQKGRRPWSGRGMRERPAGSLHYGLHKLSPQRVGNINGDTLLLGDTVRRGSLSRTLENIIMKMSLRLNETHAKTNKTPFTLVVSHFHSSFPDVVAK